MIPTRVNNVLFITTKTCITLLLQREEIVTEMQGKKDYKDNIENYNKLKK